MIVENVMERDLKLKYFSSEDCFIRLTNFSINSNDNFLNQSKINDCIPVITIGGKNSERGNRPIYFFIPHNYCRYIISIMKIFVINFNRGHSNQKECYVILFHLEEFLISDTSLV